MTSKEKDTINKWKIIGYINTKIKQEEEYLKMLEIAKEKLKTIITLCFIKSEFSKNRFQSEADRLADLIAMGKITKGRIEAYKIIKDFIKDFKEQE